MIKQRGQFGFTGKAKDIAKLINDEYPPDEEISVIINNKGE